MHSEDKTVELARQYTKKIFQFAPVGYVEPARNFGIEKARGEWILIVDADEILPESLGLKLRQLTEGIYDYYRIPRKNIIFGRWIEHSGWWPDYQIRFFRKTAVTWEDAIHSVPVTIGKGTDLPINVDEALLHRHYTSVEQYLERLNRYTSFEAKERLGRKETFMWFNLIRKPWAEFLTRYFAWEGYKDGIHGLALALLQSFSFLITELKVWQLENFYEGTNTLSLEAVSQEINHAQTDFAYWYHNAKSGEAGLVTKTVHKLRARMRR